MQALKEKKANPIIADMNYLQRVGTKTLKQKQNGKQWVQYTTAWDQRRGNKCMYQYVLSCTNIDPCVRIDHLWRDLQEADNSN